MAEAAENFAPYWSSMSANRPFELSKFLTLLPPGNTIITNYIGSNEKEPGEDTIVNRLKFKKISLK